MKLFGFASIKLTVLCLFWLGVLTFWGTIYQVDHGIYQAQARFFDSLVFFGFGFIPFPGGMLTMGLLFFNLLASFFVHYQAGWKMPGLMLIHLGLLLLLLGGFFIRLTGISAQIQLLPGEGTNLAESTSEWELSMLEEVSSYRQVRGIDFSDLKKGTRFRMDDSGLRFRVLEQYENAQPMRLREQMLENAAVPANASGIHRLDGRRLAKEPPQNQPGLVLEVEGAKEFSRVLLWGGENRLLAVELPDGDVRFIALRRKQYELPLFMELMDFQRTYYPGSQRPKDFRSLINVHIGGAKGEDIERNAIIKMNEPFRYQGWTFYQQSFAVMDNDTELSIFAVTRNYGRLIPYWATGITSVGLAMHFIQMLVLQMRRRRKSA
ncbi:MAG: cytochrome c biogenesis protein ResB [Verrucomicrobia bacterium]|nr:cytochrome c biogenesis protein ResB [Verrucomicrobiota bacterium]MCH8513190.1 cytochrome c biogenesis protein ResB [Kiritimatiellia bacterium]